MPLSFEIYEDLDVVITTAEGLVTSEDLADHAAALINQPNRPLRELTDFSDRVEITVSVDSVRDAGTRLQYEDTNPPGSKLAMVARTEALYGLLRLFQAHREHPNVEVLITRDRNEAVRWLGFDPATFPASKVLDQLG